MTEDKIKFLLALEHCNLEMLDIFLDNIKTEEDREEALRIIGPGLSESDTVFEYKEVIVLLKDSYLACVKCLTTGTNHELADSNGRISLNLIKDEKSPIYKYLIEQQQEPKKRRRSVL